MAVALAGVRSLSQVLETEDMSRSRFFGDESMLALLPNLEAIAIRCIEYSVQ